MAKKKGVKKGTKRGKYKTKKEPTKVISKRVPVKHAPTIEQEFDRIIKKICK